MDCELTFDDAVKAVKSFYASQYTSWDEGADTYNGGYQEALSDVLEILDDLQKGKNPFQEDK